MHFKPGNWMELFEFVGYMKVKNMFKEIALAKAKAGRRVSE
jgi:hypothetical protein